MDKPAPVAAANIVREELHCRRIEMRGYRRSDGLYEVEAHLVDTKGHDFKAACSDEIKPTGTHLHDMWLTLVYDKKMVVHEVRTVTDASPYPTCPMAGAQLQALVGLSMTSGWNAEVRKRLGRAENCTHLVGLLGPMASTAFQSMNPVRADSPQPVDQNGRPLKIDSCYAYATSGEVVQRMWPEYYRPADQAD